MFSNIDSHMKAYMLGIYTHMLNDIPDMSHIVCNDNDFTLCNVLGKTIKNTLPPFKDKSLTWAYIRGYFDRHGTIVVSTTECKIVTHNAEFAAEIGKFSEIPHRSNGIVIYYTGINVIDFLGNMYKDKGGLLYDRNNYYVFVKLLNPCIRNPANCMVFKTDANAVIPSKGKYTDVGYDLTVIKKAKEWNKKTTLYDTCIKIQVENGYYAEVVPRSSLSKSGYMLANSVGIIDPNYTGNILIALVKVDEDAPDLELPFRCCQLIFRKHVIADMIESDTDFGDTSRGQGGFGSSG
jgi:deoxyuridine 5'-triphosphate nucleotidohydrolase